MTWEAELARTALFEGVSDEVLADLASRAVHRRYRKGSIVFVQGEKGNRCYVIVSGSVKISAYHPDGREVVLGILGPADVFGELALFDEAPRSADAVVLESTELLSLDDEALRTGVAKHPELGLGLLRTLADRLRQANDAFQDIALFDVTGRVARRLADLAQAHGSRVEGGILIDLELSQESLAGMVGATRESVNKALGALTRRELVTRRGRRYVVTDVDELRARAR